MPKRAHTVALATPCWPAPVSATMRCLPSRCASSAWPTALLILCAPVCARSSRLSQMRAPPTSARQPLGEVERRLAADVVAAERGQLGREGRVGERGRRARPRARRAPPSPSRARSARRSGRSARARPARAGRRGPCAQCSSRLLRRGDEASHALVVLDAGGALDAARAVDAVRAHLAHGLRHVVRGRAAPPAAAGARPRACWRAASARRAPRRRASRPMAGRRRPARPAGRRRRRRRARRGSRARRSARRARAARRRAAARGRARRTRPARRSAAGSSSTNTPTSGTPAGTASRIAPRLLLGRQRGLRGQKITPIMSAPAATATAASSGRVTPQILTTVTRSPHERRQQVGVAHQRRADEQRIGAGIAHGARVVGRLDARLGDAQEAARQAPQQLDLAAAVDLERREIARVDADDRRRRGRARAPARGRCAPRRAPPSRDPRRPG